MGLRLHIRVPEAAPRFVELLDETEVLVGRGADCAVAVAHATLSSRHASIRARHGRVEVRDEGSRFGTQVGTLALVAGVWVEWPADQVLWLGDVELAWEVLDDDRTVLLDAPAPAAADDSGLWSVAMERDSAHSLVSQEAIRPMPAAPSQVMAEPAISEDSLASGGEGAAAAVAATPVAAEAQRGPDQAMEPVPAARPAGRLRRVSAARRLVAAVAALVSVGALAFGVWVLAG